MKKILIPTDFSINSIHTIDYIIDFFKYEDCQFYFLNNYIYDTSGLNAIELLQADDDWFEKPKNESLLQLGKLVERHTLNSNNSKHEFNAISKCIALVDGIKVSIDEVAIDLVILSGSGEKAISKLNESILEKIRSCPFLIVPPNAAVCNDVYITIASDFKQKVNTIEIDKFCKTLTNTNYKIGILVLEASDTLDIDAANNLEIFTAYLKIYSGKHIDIEYIHSSNELKNYAVSHHDDIICVIDQKPNLFRKIGLYKSKVISKIAQLRHNTVLTIHQ